MTTTAQQWEKEVEAAKLSGVTLTKKVSVFSKAVVDYSATKGDVVVWWNRRARGTWSVSVGDWRNVPVPREGHGAIPRRPIYEPVAADAVYAVVLCNNRHALLWLLLAAHESELDRLVKCVVKQTAYVKRLKEMIV